MILQTIIAALKLITTCIKHRLSNPIIASILLNEKHGISQRPLEKGDKLTLKDINRIRKKLRNNPRYYSHQPPHYHSDELPSPQNAQKTLKKTIDHFFQNPQGTLGVRAAAGIGKTTTCIDALIQYSDDYKLIEIYCPTHELGREIEAQLREKAPDIEVKVVRGRSHQDEDGQTLCYKGKYAEKLAKSASTGVYHSFCNNNNGEKCRSFAHCGYLGQYSADTQIRIYTHAHLPLKRSLVDKEIPDLVIIDESYFQTLIDKKSITIATLKRHVKNQKLYRTLKVALRKNHPLLSYLRINHGNSVLQVIQECINDLDSSQTNISPKMDVVNIKSKIKYVHSKTNIIKNLLSSLLTLDYQVFSSCFLKT